MAEFIEVARAKRRMCNAHKKRCSECKLQENCSLLNVFAYNDNEVKKLENEVMSWAAENPEPVYPSIAKYLERFGILIRRDGSLEADYFKANEPMGEDLAKLLGIDLEKDAK